MFIRGRPIAGRGPCRSNETGHEDSGDMSAARRDADTGPE